MKDCTIKTRKMYQKGHDIMKEKTKGELLSEKLFLEKKNSYEIMTKSDIDDAYKYAEGYKNIISEAKTEREAVKITQQMAEKCGFTEFEYGKKYSAGDKLYVNNRGKSIFLIVLGKESLENGVSIAVSHIDSPRIDLKQCPLYEDSGLAFFKTHYYGGIKKYQWTALPLALHGTIAKKDGSKIDIVIGEKEDDPVFYITDLLPHLAQDQMSKTAAKVISGENLNILAGSVPYNDEKVSEKIKLNILSILNESYGICESDFLSSELCLVPAGKVRDAGLDRSMLCGYGHDDKVCAYPIVTSALEASKKIPSKTLITILADKEEVGSEGNTGMKSYAFFNVLSDIAENMGVNKYKMFENSKCLSADVNAAFDPNYADVYEAKNSSFVNKGIVVTKFTGARGKSSTNDASAEYVAEIRNIFDKAGIVWQTGELGKVDQGGGGTVAMYISEKNIDTVDVGVPVLSMHAPFEIISKTDLYSAHKAFLSFFKR